MKRFIALLAGLVMIMASNLAAAQAKFQEGKHYEDVAPQLSAQNLSKTVNGFFWYGCSHCYAFEPTLEKWLEHKPVAIEFVRTPAVLGRNWVPHAQAFYATEQLGISDKTHQKLFDAIHRYRLKLFAPTEIAEFLAQHSNVPAAKILVHMQSEDTRKAIGESIETAQKYRLRGVPSVLVGGKYLVDPGAAGEEFGELINFLLNQ